MTEAPNHIKNILQSLQDITGVKAETIFTVFITLFVFGAGIITNWIINLIKENRQRKNYQETINLLLLNLSDVCKRQHKITLKDLDSYSILDTKKIGFQIQVYAPLQFLNKMDYSLFVRYYVRGCNRKLKIKAVSRIFQIIGYSNIFETDNQEKIKYFLSLIEPMQEMYLKNMLTLEEFGREILFIETVDYSFKESLIIIFDNWKTKHTDNNFRTSFTNLISPLIRLFENYTMEPLAKDLSKLVNECHLAYSEIAHTDVLIIRHLKLFAYENKRIHRQLNVILRIFNFRKS